MNVQTFLQEQVCYKQTDFFVMFYFKMLIRQFICFVGVYQLLQFKFNFGMV